MGILKIPVTKAGNATIDVETDDLPEAVYAAALAEGLKVMLNAKMSKVLSPKDKSPEERAEIHAAALKVATQNLAAIVSGEYKKGHATAAKDADGNKVSGVVMSEARRLAKIAVKDSIRAAGMKISHVEAKDITKAANELIAADPSFIAEAQKNLKARATAPVAIDIKSLVSESPKLIKAAEERKAERKTTLSAKQAGKVAPRKGTAPSQLNA